MCAHITVCSDRLAGSGSLTHTHTRIQKIVFLLVQKVKTCQGLSQGKCPPTPPPPHPTVLYTYLYGAPNCPCNLFPLKDSCNLQRVKTPKDIEKLCRIPIFQGSSKRCSVYIMAIWTILYYIWHLVTFVVPVFSITVFHILLGNILLHKKMIKCSFKRTSWLLLLFIYFF